MAKKATNMRLEKYEYVVKRKDDLETITITKDALLQWAEHYFEVSQEYTSRLEMAMFYNGKQEVLLDILKHFEDGND